MEDEAKDIMPSIEDHLVLRDFEYVLGDIPTLPPKRDIDFSIDLVPGATPVSKIPYIMDILELK